jgi:hypothetical protein
MDPVTERAISDYERLLGGEQDLVEEIYDRFLDRMRAAKLTFGGRVHCPFPRPNFVSPAADQQIRDVCRGIFRAIETVEDRLGRALWDRVDLTAEERELVAIEPGYRRSSPTSRLDAFLTTSRYQFVELNAETPAGGAYADILAEVFLALPLVKKFQESWKLERLPHRQRLLETLVSCYRQAGGRAERPTIAVMDYEEVPTRTEHHMCREFFEERGYASVVCDPRHVSYEKGRLRYEDTAIDIVYKRLLVNEFLDRIGELQPLLRAIKDRAVVLVNPFRCKPMHKKAIFAVLTDDELLPLFSDEERVAIAAHVPWTRRVREGKTTRQGKTIDLPAFIRDNRERLVMKPNDDYGGKGVFIGWETSATEWDTALVQALGASYVVQEKVELRRQSFPELDGRRLRYRDMIVDLDPYVFEGEVFGYLTRLSGTSLANVTSGGGQVPAFLVEPR